MSASSAQSHFHYWEPSRRACVQAPISRGGASHENAANSLVTSVTLSGNRISAWRFAPWIQPMTGHNSKRAKQFLVVVNNAIVYQNMEFSHSLALGSAWSATP